MLVVYQLLHSLLPSFGTHMMSGVFDLRTHTHGDQPAVELSTSLGHDN